MREFPEEFRVFFRDPSRPATVIIKKFLLEVLILSFFLLATANCA